MPYLTKRFYIIVVLLKVSPEVINMMKYGMELGIGKRKMADIMQLKSKEFDDTLNGVLRTISTVSISNLRIEVRKIEKARKGK